MAKVKLPGRRITLECDECGEELDMDYSDHTLGFKEMIRDAQETYDWTVTKNSDDEWEHRCENCSDVREKD